MAQEGAAIDMAGGVFVDDVVFQRAALAADAVNQLIVLFHAKSLQGCLSAEAHLTTVRRILAHDRKHYRARAGRESIWPRSRGPTGAARNAVPNPIASNTDCQPAPPLARMAGDCHRAMRVLLATRPVSHGAL